MESYETSTAFQNVPLCCQIIFNFTKPSPSRRSYPVHSKSRNSPYFTEPQDSLPHSQHPSNRPYPEPDPSSLFLPAPHCWRSVLIVSSHPQLVLQSGLFSSGFPTETLYAPLLSALRATFPTHLTRLHLTTRIMSCVKHALYSSSLRILLQDQIYTKHPIWRNVTVTLTSETNEHHFSVSNSLSYARFSDVYRDTPATCWEQWQLQRLALTSFWFHDFCTITAVT